MRRRRERTLDPRYPLKGFRVLDREVDSTATVDGNGWDGPPVDYYAWKVAEELATASGFKLVVESPPEGDVVTMTPLPENVEYAEQTIADSVRGSFFARRPDEKGRPRRKRGDPPPPMSDLLSEVQHD